MLLAVLAVVAVVAIVIWQPWRGSTAASSASPSGSPTSPAPTTPAPTTPAPTTPPPTEAAPTPAVSPTADAVAPCTTGNIELVPTTDKESYGGGEFPQLSMTLTNNSNAPCLINVGTSTQSFTITSGSDTWWRSTDCQTEPSDQVVQLEARQTVASVTPLSWDRTRSAVDTCGGPRAVAPAGYFHLTVSIGGIDSRESAVFVLG